MLFSSLVHFLHRNKGKLIVCAVIIAYLVLLYRGRIEMSSPYVWQWNVHTARTMLLAQQKYLQGGRLEYVTFQSLHSAQDTTSTLERRGILYTYPNAKATIVMCHGFMCNKLDIAFIRYALFSQYNVLVFDFRAHGENIDSSQCCTFGKEESLDVIAAVNYLKQRTDLKNVPRICYGFSMGAVAAILAQSEDPTLFDAMILDCPYDESENVLKHSIQKLYVTVFGYAFDIPGRGFLERFAFNPYVQGFLKTVLRIMLNMDATATNTIICPASPVVAVRDVKVPCLFIHCKNDEKVPVSAAKNIYENAAGYKRLWITNGRRHFDSIFYNPDKYSYKVKTFINDFLTKRYMRKKSKKIVVDKPIEEPLPGF